MIFAFGTSVCSSFPWTGFPFLLKFSLCSIKNPISLHLDRCSELAAGQGGWVFADSTDPPSLCPRMKSRWQAGLCSLTQPTRTTCARLHGAPCRPVSLLFRLCPTVLPGIPIFILPGPSVLPLNFPPSSVLRHTQCADRAAGEPLRGGDFQKKGERSLSKFGVQHRSTYGERTGFLLIASHISPTYSPSPSTHLHSPLPSPSLQVFTSSWPCPGPMHISIL